MCYNGVRAYTNLLCGMNELDQCRLLSNVQSTGNKELGKILGGAETTNTKLGHEPTNLVYSDICCTHRNVVEASFPNVKPKGRSKPGVSVVPLPTLALTENSKVNVIRYIHDCTIDIAKIIACQKEGGADLPMYIGFDAEWCVDFQRRKTEKISCIQLCYKHEGEYHISIFHLKKLKGVPQELKNLLTCDKFIFVGKQSEEM